MSEINLNKIDKKWILLNSETGEVLPITLEEGLKIRHRDNLKDGQANKKDGFAKKLQQDEFQRYVDNMLGNFNFCFYLRLKELNLKPQMLFRFVYLCTYINYDGILMKNKKTKLVRKDFDVALKLSKKETIRTLNTLKQEGLLIDNGGVYMIDNTICKRGKLDKKEMGEEFARIFDNGIRELYEKASPKEHKFLSVLINLLPHINKEYNLVCHNIEETNLKSIKLYNFTQLAEKMGYKNDRTFKRELLKIKVGGQYAIALVMVGGVIGVYINPQLYYKGSDINQLKSILAVFEEASKE